ncbi:hypothetical protein [Alsobacter sp. R-9]
MTKSLRLGAILLLSTTALGVAIAVAPVHADGRKTAGQDVAEAHETSRLIFASESRSRHHDRNRRHHHDDDDDDDDGEDGRGGMRPPRAAAPDAPVPDNGLFSGKARPKVDVQ